MAGEVYIVERVDNKRVRNGKVRKPKFSLLRSKSLILFYFFLISSGRVLTEVERLQRGGEHLGASTEPRVPNVDPGV